MQTMTDMKNSSFSDRAKHSLNSSKAKAQFSFSKAQRFPNRAYKSTSQLKFYDIKDTRHKPRISFSCNQRADFVKKDGVPPSTYYNIVSTLKNKDNGIIFKSGRDQCKSNCLFAQASNNNPGPGQYTLDADKKYKSVKYSMGKKFKTQFDVENQESTPGPKYDIHSSLLDRNKMLSIYVRRGSTRIVNPVSNVFKRQTKTTQQPIKKQPQIQNRYITVKGRKNFGHNTPQTIIKPPVIREEQKANKRAQTPGPGYYRSFSQFD